MSNVEHIPSLEWTRTDFGDLAADLGNGQRLVISNGADDVRLLLNGKYMGDFVNERAALAYAKTWVGDDDA